MINGVAAACARMLLSPRNALLCHRDENELDVQNIWEICGREKNKMVQRNKKCIATSCSKRDRNIRVEQQGEFDLAYEVEVPDNSINPIVDKLVRTFAEVMTNQGHIVIPRKTIVVSENKVVQATILWNAMNGETKDLVPNEIVETTYHRGGQSLCRKCRTYMETVEIAKDRHSTPSMQG
jgi:hypothetical protein